MHIFSFANSLANICAYFLPYSEQFLDPTIATILLWFNNFIFPLQNNCCGYSFIFSNFSGYSSSKHFIIFIRLPPCEKYYML